MDQQVARERQCSFQPLAPHPAHSLEVDVGSGLVQHQDLVVPVQSTGQAHQLPLTHTGVGACLCHVTAQVPPPAVPPPVGRAQPGGGRLLRDIYAVSLAERAYAVLYNFCCILSSCRAGATRIGVVMLCMGTRFTNPFVQCTSVGGLGACPPNFTAAYTCTYM